MSGRTNKPGVDWTIDDLTAKDAAKLERLAKAETAEEVAAIVEKRLKARPQDKVVESVAGVLGLNADYADYMVCTLAVRAGYAEGALCALQMIGRDKVDAEVIRQIEAAATAVRKTLTKRATS